MDKLRRLASFCLCLSICQESLATTVRSARGNSATTGTAVSITAPAGSASGDLMICVVHANGNTTIVDNNGASAFTEDLNDFQDTTPGQTVSLFSRRLVGGDTTSYAFTIGASGRWGVICVAFQSPNASTIYDATHVETATPGSAPITSGNSPSVTTATSNAIHCAIIAPDGSDSAAFNTPAGYTSQATTTGPSQGMAFDTKVIAAAGATGTVGFTWTGNTADGYIGLGFAIKDDAGAAAATVCQSLGLLGVGCQQ